MDDAAPVPSTAASSPVRGGSGRDMLISLAVLLVPLVLLIAFCQPDKSSSTPHAIDPSGTYQLAREHSGFGVRQPARLRSGWRATRASFAADPGKAPVLRVNYVTSADDYVQLVQSAAQPQTVIAEELGDGKFRRQENIAGATWQRYGGAQVGDTAFVLPEPDVTVIVVGDAPADQLRDFISSLRRG